MASFLFLLLSIRICTSLSFAAPVIKYNICTYIHTYKHTHTHRFELSVQLLFRAPHTFCRIIKIVARDGKIGLYIFRVRSGFSRQEEKEEGGTAGRTGTGEGADHALAYTHTDMKRVLEGREGDADGVYCVSVEIEPVPQSRHISDMPEER